MVVADVSGHPIISVFNSQAAQEEWLSFFESLDLKWSSISIEMCPNCFTFEEWTEWLSRNVGKYLPINAAQHLSKAKT